jgi:outer membrane protein insertion porin family
VRWLLRRTRSPLFLFFLSLFIGIGVGLFVRLEDWAARNLMGLLADEIRDGTEGCTLEYETAQLSLLRLFAVTKNVNVLCQDKSKTRDGEPIAMHFDEITVSVGLRKLASLTVTLDEIRLKHGYANGVGPNSATYKFIDYLSAPVSPERAQETRLRLELVKLTLEDSQIFEALGKNLLVGSGAHMTVSYNERRDVILSPHIEHLSYRIRGKSESTMPLGQVNGAVQITDDKTIFHSVTVGDHDELKLKGEDLAHHDKGLSGDGALAFPFTYIGLPDWLQAQIAGQYTVSGDLGSPVLQGTFNLQDQTKASIAPGGIEILGFDKLSSSFVVDVNDGDPIVTLADLSGSRDGAKLDTEKPVTIKDGAISGSLKLFAKNITVGSIAWNDVSSTLKLSGPLAAIKADFQGTIATTETLGATIRGIDFSAHSEDGIFDVNANHHAGTNGRLQLQAKINVATNEALVEAAQFTLTDYPVAALYQASLTPDQEQLIRLSGSGKASGPFDPARMRLEATAGLSSNILPLQPESRMNLAINLGDLKLQVSDPAKLFTADLLLGLTDQKNTGKLQVNFTAHNQPPFTSFDCSDSSGTITYTYPRQDFFSGDGSIALRSLALGCNPVALSLAAPSTLPIKKGAIQLSPLKLLALSNPLTFSGSVEPTKNLAFNVKGLLPLQTIEPLLPAIDELSGTAALNLSVHGTFAEPILSGHADLQSGLFAFEKSQLLLENIKGSLDFSNTGITFQNIRGDINGGRLSMQGAIFPLHPDSSTVSATIKGAAFAPASGFSFLSDADLSLKNQNNKPVVSGTVTIASADFERKLDLITLAREVTSLLFSSSKMSNQGSMGQAGGSSTASSFDLPLDVKVIAKRNIFAVTNFFGTELKADLSLRGTLSQPDVVGTVESLSGWFGLREQRFDLTSGTVIFKGKNTIPEISVTGESLVRSGAGDIVTVYLDAHGTIAEPKFTLSSDTGLSQKDILTLLTSSGQTMQQTAINTLGRDVQVGGMSLLADVPILSYSRFLRYLGQVDSISIEPQFNLQTGLIEPTISATKNITDNFYLLGQGYLGSQVTETKIGAVYNILPYLNIAAFFTSASYQQNVALEVNSTVTLLAQQKKFIDISVKGNQLFSEREILKGARLNQASRIPPDEMQNIRQAIRRFYRQRGYFDTRIKSICRSDGEYCREISLTIEEGSLSTIAAVRIEDPDNLDSALAIPSSLLPSLASGDAALTEPLVDARDEILRWLRKKGFISARIEALYERTGTPLQRAMVFKIKRGRNVTFLFRGNKVFSDDQLLDSINLYNRKVPFGTNTINILTDNIIQLYKELRYLDVSVESHITNQPSPADGGIEHTITITEGPRYSIERARFEGVTHPQHTQFDRLIEKEGRAFTQSILYPSSILDDTLSLRARDLSQIARAAGYDAAEVSASLTKDSDQKTAAPVYTFQLGEQLPTVTIQTQCSNTQLTIPQPPKGPTYPQGLREYMQELEKSLLEQGYRAPTFSEERTEPSQLTILIDEGPVTEAGSLNIIGNQDISAETIKELLKIMPGEPLQLQNIRAMKQKLLNRGLFSRVDIEEVDSGDPTIKNLQIRVVEKPLRTLDVGGGYNTEFGAHVFAEGSDRALFKDGRSLTLRLDAYVNSPNGDPISRGIAALKYTDPNVLGSRYVLTEDLRFQKLNASIQEFNLDRVALSSGLYRSWDSGLSIAAGHTILDENITDVPSDVVLTNLDEGNVKLSYLSSTITLDKRDNPLNPLSGYSLTFDARFSDDALLSDAQYWGTGLRATNIIPITFGENTFAIAQSLRGAISQTFGGDEFVPISQRYYLGGRNSIRGYQENSLGPRGKDGGTIGGESLLAGSLELQYRAYESLSFNIFMDAGNVYLDGYDPKAYGVPDDIRKEDDAFLRYASGVGMRFLSPIGPVGLDLGFPLNGREEDSPWRLHFNIGSNF